MNCQQCRNEFETDDRVAFNTREAFVFKPAHVQDPEVLEPNGRGGFKKINLAATLSPDALRNMRKDHLKTEIATCYWRWGYATPPEGAFNFRHVSCGVVRTAAGAGGLHPVQKHSIRFSRMMPKRFHGQSA